jgi:putative FmdB family regulatory protein
MPRYEFACLACGGEFTAELSSKERNRLAVACPHCKSTMVEQLVTTCEVITVKKS